MIKIKNKEVVKNLQEALASGDQEKITNAWEDFRVSIADTIKEDFEEVHAEKDDKILAQRGYKILTSKEKKWYNKVIEAMKSNNPAQNFATIIGSNEEDELMPNTIIEDVYKDLQEVHPLLSKVKFTYVRYMTKWLLTDKTVKKAVWGAINSTITEEITGSFRTVDIKQNKLSCYAVIERDMLDLGPTFLDAYIRANMMEAMSVGFEEAIVKGTGANCPIGLDRDIHHGVSVSGGAYPQKSTTSITDFSPASYGTVLATLAKTESWTDDTNGVVHGGCDRAFTSVQLICNQKEYLTKVMPATTVLNSNGLYVNNLFPFPTDVIISNAVPDNKAILCLLDEYFLGVGGSKEGIIEYSDDFKFLEDKRTFKVKLYADGQATDDTCAVYLDITNLDPAYLNVVTKVSEA